MENFIKKSGMYLYVGAPHTVPGNEFSLKSLWKQDKKALAVMWSSDFDINAELPWWYCIIDHPFSIDALKSKRRAEIRKACQSFKVKKINSADYATELASITYSAWQEYSADYRPNRSKENLARIFQNHSKNEHNHYFGCFDAESDELVGFANCYENDDWIEFRSMKMNKACKNGGGGALVIVCAICTNYMAVPNGIRYLCDGQRNIVHQTNFQEFLVTKFGFRYAYARLNIRYRPAIYMLVKLLYPFRKLFINSGIGTLRRVGTLLSYEEIARKCHKLIDKNNIAEKDLMSKETI